MNARFSPFEKYFDITGMPTSAGQQWMAQSAGIISPVFSGVPVVPSYTVATLPGAVAGGVIFVTNETGGAVLAFSDGVSWRRVTDRAVVA